MGWWLQVRAYGRVLRVRVNQARRSELWRLNMRSDFTQSGMRRGGLWRSRWAAVGAAVAVSLGAGNVLWAHADQTDNRQLPIQEIIELRQSGRADSPRTAKQPTWSDEMPTSGEALTTDAGVSAAAFVPITPYRSFDTRMYSDGFILWGESGSIDLTTDVNDYQMIPANAVAVTYNLTVTGTYGSYGYLSLFPAGSAAPATSSINWFSPSLDLANGGVVALNGGDVGVLCGDVSETGTDFIIDITGYYIK